MLSRPVGCQYVRQCALDRVCWQAKQRELAAHKRHERFIKAESEPVKLANISVARVIETPQEFAERLDEGLQDDGVEAA